MKNIIIITFFQALVDNHRQECENTITASQTVFGS